MSKLKEVKVEEFGEQPASSEVNLRLNNDYYWWANVEE